MKNFKLKTAALLSAGTMVLSMTGCGDKNNKNSILEDTLLEKTIVATVDGDISVLRPISSKNRAYSQYEAGSKEHQHYFDIINGGYITTDRENCDSSLVTAVESIEKKGSIQSFLTEDEMLKAKNDELTEDDVVAIVYRIKESTEEKENSKAK